MNNGRKAVTYVQPEEVLVRARNQEDVERCGEGIKTEASFPKAFDAGGGLVRLVDFQFFIRLFGS